MSFCGKLRALGSKLGAAAVVGGWPAQASPISGALRPPAGRHLRSTTSLFTVQAMPPSLEGVAASAAVPLPPPPPRPPRQPCAPWATATAPAC